MESDTDSDFYGDEAMAGQLQSRVDSYDVSGWWQQRRGIRDALQTKTEKQAAARTSAAHLHNPYAGIAYAWQLTETVDDFLKRLPPATTDETPENPWIFICNPYVDRKSKGLAQNQQVRGGEDEAPEAQCTDLPRFLEGGRERLHMVTEFSEFLKKSSKSQMVITREVNKAGKDAAGDILNLAQHLDVRCGKWMLFCSMRSVNETWELIAKATANNELGIAAKVAPRSEGDQRTERVICVYTADFNDRADVQRVAQSLKGLGLIPHQGQGRPLYWALALAIPGASRPHSIAPSMCSENLRPYGLQTGEPEHVEGRFAVTVSKYPCFHSCCWGQNPKPKKESRPAPHSTQCLPPIRRQNEAQNKPMHAKIN